MRHSKGELYAPATMMAGSLLYVRSFASKAHTTRAFLLESSTSATF